MKMSAVCKSLAVLTVLGGSALFTTGCSHSGLETDLLGPPGYSSKENASREWRYAAYDFQQAVDEFDRDVTMTRPGSKLTLWNVQRSD